MNRWWIVSILALVIGVGGFALGRVGRDTALSETAATDVQQAYFLLNQANHEPAPWPKELWTSEGMGYLQASVSPLESLGISNMNIVATALTSAAYDSLRHHATPQQRRLLGLFQQQMASFHEYSVGTIPVAKLKQAMTRLAWAASR